jgi:hypothetical protein
MMKIISFSSFVWYLLILMFPLPLPAAPAGERRAIADKAMAEGNWNDALNLWKDILPLPDNTGVEVASDLGKAIQCLQRLNKLEQWDALVEDTVKAHAGDWILLRDAGIQYQSSQPWGTLTSGEYRRGQYLLEDCGERSSDGRRNPGPLGQGFRWRSPDEQSREFFLPLSG